MSATIQRVKQLSNPAREVLVNAWAYGYQPRGMVRSIKVSQLIVISARASISEKSAKGAIGELVDSNLAELIGSVGDKTLKLTKLGEDDADVFCFAEAYAEAPSEIMIKPRS
jgi:hypothetical protein